MSDFKRGDKVRHKGSHQQAVYVRQSESNRYYCFVSTGFDSGHIEVHKSEIEKVKEEKMSDFKEGDLLQHRVSRERCVVVSIISEFKVEVATKLSEKYQICSIFELTKVKEESNG